MEQTLSIKNVILRPELAEFAVQLELRLRQFDNTRADWQSGFTSE